MFADEIDAKEKNLLMFVSNQVTKIPLIEIKDLLYEVKHKGEENGRKS